MDTFAFKHEITNSATAHSSLSETMSLDSDHVQLSYNTKFEGKDLNPIKQKLRKVEVSYSNEPAFMKDV